MINDYQFNNIIMKLFEGYGRTIKPEQLKIWYHQMTHVTEPALRAAAKKWINTEERPPTVAGLLKILGLEEQSTKMHVCTSCGSEVEHIYTCGTGENRRLLCGDCWYDLAEKMKMIPEYRKRGYEKPRRIANENSSPVN